MAHLLNAIWTAIVRFVSEEPVFSSRGHGAVVKASVAGESLPQSYRRDDVFCS